MSTTVAEAPFCSAEAPGCSTGSLKEALLGCSFWESSSGLSAAQFALQGIVAAAAVLLCAFYIYLHIFRAFRQWLVTYFTAVVAAQYLVAMTAPGQPPAFLYLPCTAPVNWLRYAAWLLIAPAILIVLLRAPGLDPRGRCPRLLEPILILHLLTVVLGITTAFAADIGTKAGVFAVAGVFGVAGFLCSALAYLEHFTALGDQRCRTPLLTSAGLFYVVWVMYPVLFMLGPEGFGSLSPAASDIGYAITDLVKLAWGVAIWWLNGLCRVLVEKHGTTEKQLVLPFGLGTSAMVVLCREEAENGSGGNHEGGDAAAASALQHGSPPASFTMKDKSGDGAAKATSSVPDGEEDDEIIAPPPPGERCMEGRESGVSMASSRGSRGRLSIDVKYRLKEIVRKSQESERASLASDDGRMSMTSDPGPDGRGRLSVDVRNRVQSIAREQGAGPSWMGGTDPNADIEGSAFLEPSGDPPAAAGQLGNPPSRTVRRVSKSSSRGSMDSRPGDFAPPDLADFDDEPLVRSGGRLSVDVSKRVDSLNKDVAEEPEPESDSAAAPGGRSGGRLSIDVTQRLTTLEKRLSRSSDGRGSLDDNDSQRLVSARSSTSEKDVKKSGNRLSIDVKNRVLGIDNRKSSMSSDAGSAISDGFATSDPGGQSESRPSKDSQSRMSKDRSTLAPIGGVSGASSSQKPVELSVTNQMPWDSDGGKAGRRQMSFRVEKAAAKQEAEEDQEAQGSAVRRLTSRGTKKSTRGGSKLDFSQKEVKQPVTVLDYGPAPIPSRFPVKILVATQSEDIMDTILDQLLDHSAERPVKIVATADVLELNNLITHIRREGSMRLFDFALVHSSLVSSPLTQALRSQYSIRVVAFGSLKDYGIKREEYDGWLASKQGYIANTSMELFDEFELLRTMSYWVHQKEMKAPALL